MNAYAAAKEMALHYARKHLAIIKNSEFSREDKVKLIKIWLRLYNIPQRLKNKKKFYKCQCGRFYNGIKCNECGYSGDPVDATTTSDKHEPEQDFNEIHPKNYGCIKQKDKYLSSTWHCSIEDVLSKKYSIKEALEIGFEDTICGHKCYFTHMLNYLVDVKHEGENHRIPIIYSALKKRNTLNQSKQIGHQTIIYQHIRSSQNGSRLVIIIDTDTGIVRSISSFSNRYMKKNWNI